MSLYIFIGLFAAFSAGIAAVINSLLGKYTFDKPLTFTFYSSISNFIFLPLLLLFGLPSLPSWEVIPIYIILSLIMVLIIIPYFSALKSNDASIINSMWSIGKIILPFGAFIFLGEVLSPLQYIGFFIIIFINIFLNLKKGQKININPALFYMLCATFLNTSCVLFEKHVLNHDANWINLIFYTNIISTLFTLTFLFFRKPRKDIIANYPTFKKSLKKFALAEIASFIGHALGIYSLTGLSVVLKSALSSSEPIFVLLINFILVHLGMSQVFENVSTKAICKKLICYLILSAGIVMTLM